MLDLTKQFPPFVLEQFRDTLADYDEEAQQGKGFPDEELAAELTREFKAELGSSIIDTELLQYWREELRAGIRDEEEAKNSEEGEQSSDEPKYFGVKGWLRFFVSVLMIVQPIIVLLLLYVLWSSVLPNLEWMSQEDIAYLAIFSLGEFLLCGSGIWVAFKLDRREPEAVRYTKIWLLAAGGLGVMTFVLGVSSDFVDIRSLIQTLIWVAIWYSYFSVSQRVRCTYGTGPVAIAAKSPVSPAGKAVADEIALDSETDSDDLSEDDEEYECPSCGAPIIFNDATCKKCSEVLEW
ncbi:MAG: DUF2569 family protein [Bacteroidota bacterium]